METPDFAATTADKLTAVTQTDLTPWHMTDCITAAVAAKLTAVRATDLTPEHMAQCITVAAKLTAVTQTDFCCIKYCSNSSTTNRPHHLTPGSMLHCCSNHC